jgi:hypothetical protein
MRIPATIVLVLALAACAAPAGSVDPTPEESPVERTPPASLTPSSTQPSRVPGGGDGEELTGALGADSIEGGCAYLQASDGTRYQVLYPDGWELTISPLELTSPDGEVVARGGDDVTVRGAEAGDMASICQIGPIFRASSVVIP